MHILEKNVYNGNLEYIDLDVSTNIFSCKNFVQI